MPRVPDIVRSRHVHLCVKLLASRAREQCNNLRSGFERASFDGPLMHYGCARPTGHHAKCCKVLPDSLGSGSHSRGYLAILIPTRTAIASIDRFVLLPCKAMQGYEDQPNGTQLSGSKG